MFKHKLTKHQEYEMFKSHHPDNSSFYQNFTNNISERPFSSLGAAAIAGFFLGLLIR